MKKIFAILLPIMLVVFFASSISVFADDMKPRSIDAIISEIRVEQGIKSTEKINPDKVSQVKLEELGDSVMEAMIGNTAMHERMDIRLGGDGSASLRATHVRIGYNYLIGYPDGMMAMMGSGMMYKNNYFQNGNYYGNDGVMGYIGWYKIAGAAFFIMLLVATPIVALRLFNKRLPASSNDSAMDILKIRYAKGEITFEEYEKMAESLRK